VYYLFILKVHKGERTKWILSRNASNQLGHTKEIQRLNIERQVKFLFKLWDYNNTGKIGGNKIMHKLIDIGLGGSPEFTQSVFFAVRVDCVESFWQS
jgi:hypothetical protein